MTQFTKRAKKTNKQIAKHDKMNRYPTMIISEKYKLKTIVCEF